MRFSKKIIKVVAVVFILQSVLLIYNEVNTLGNQELYYYFDGIRGSQIFRITFLLPLVSIIASVLTICFKIIFKEADIVKLHRFGYSFLLISLGSSIGIGKPNYLIYSFFIILLTYFLYSFITNNTYLKATIMSQKKIGFIILLFMISTIVFNSLLDMLIY
jgi:hypothetical protein